MKLTPELSETFSTFLKKHPRGAINITFAREAIRNITILIKNTRYHFDADSKDMITELNRFIK